MKLAELVSRLEIPTGVDVEALSLQALRRQNALLTRGDQSFLKTLNLWVRSTFEMKWRPRAFSRVSKGDSDILSSCDMNDKHAWSLCRETWLGDKYVLITVHFSNRTGLWILPCFYPWSAKCNLKIMGGTNNRLSWGRSKENLSARAILLFQETFREFCVLFCFVLTSNGS